MKYNRIVAGTKTYKRVCRRKRGEGVREKGRWRGSGKRGKGTQNDEKEKKRINEAGEGGKGRNSRERRKKLHAVKYVQE